jgi:hypothetical protein
VNGSVGAEGMSIRFVIIAVVSTLLALAAFWGLWSRMILKVPNTRARSVAAALGFLLFSSFPAVFVLDGIAAEEVTHFVRGAGPNQTYGLAQQPAQYWLTISLLYAAFLFLFVGFLFMLRAAFRTPLPCPNNAMQARRQARAPDEVR